MQWRMRHYCFICRVTHLRRKKAAGQAEPTFCEAVELIDEGIHGKAIACHTRQQLAWQAPHNIICGAGDISILVAVDGIL